LPNYEITKLLNSSMTELELQHLRREKWHIDGEPVRTIEDAREFIDSVGMALVYPTRPMPLLPTLIGAVAASDRNLPERRKAPGHARAKEAEDLLARMLRDKLVFEARFGTETLLLSPSIFAYYYALASDRNPRQPIRTRTRGKGSPLAEHAFCKLEEKGPLTEKRLQELLGKAVSETAVERALHELSTALKITRTQQSAEGDIWDVYYRWAPREVEEGVRLSDVEALSALISKYLDCVVAATQDEIESFFSAIASRMRVSEVVRALLAAREFVYTPSETRTLITVAHNSARSETPRANADRALASPARRRRNG
jgi:hypothetical protein